ncbi:MAG: hypothetical protein M3418_07340, partial [Gemmatimonadota bacterium]|nr:hypothetical protein [Gemmatimonadota bacterium]
GIGESRLFTREQLAALASANCLRFPASDAEYVLTALNPSEERIPGNERLDPMVTLRSWTESASVASASLAPSAIVSASRSEDHAHTVAAATSIQTSRDPYSNSPTPFDPRYRTAQVGDTVLFVDWKVNTFPSTGQNICVLDKARMPTYKVVVAAIAGTTVIGVDSRISNAADHLSEFGKQWLATGARIADPLILPTMREVYDRNFQQPGGGGDRHWHIVGEWGAAGVARDGGTASPQQRCPNASEMIATGIGAQSTNRTPLMARNLAKIIIHEYAHNADNITAARRGLYGTPVAFSEPFAVLAEETAVRIASSQSYGALHSRVTDQHPFSFHALGTLWGQRPEWSSWKGSGNYEQGASLLMFARERFGDAPIGSPNPRLYLHMLRDGPWTLSDLAAAAGMTGPALLDAWALAHATSGLVPAQTADAAGLPRFRTWELSDRGRPQPNVTVSRTTGITRTLAAAPGSYAAAYLLADGGRGISLEVTGIADRPMVVRLTRLR